MVSVLQMTAIHLANCFLTPALSGETIPLPFTLTRLHIFPILLYLKIFFLNLSVFVRVCQGSEGQISLATVCGVYQRLQLSKTLHLKRELLSENAGDNCQHLIQICGGGNELTA